MERRYTYKHFEQNESVPERDWEFEKNQYEELYTNFVKKYEDRMKQLDAHEEDFVNENSFNGVSAGHHIMYKCYITKQKETMLMSPDGQIGYEFLIEFDLKNPEYGIYYGCRGHIKEGNQKEGIERIKGYWEKIKGEVCAVLNNTFVDKDFSKRFQDTNNANNKTYWPFWIALGEDEDIIKVAARATKLIRNVYNKYIMCMDGDERQLRSMDDVKKKPILRTNYTKEAYKGIINQLKESAENDSKKKERVKIYELFIKRLQENCHISVDDRYEKCYKFRSLKKVEVHYLIEEFCNKLLFKDDAISRRNPWRYFSPLFLSKDEKDFCNIRTSTTKKGKGHNFNKAKTMKKVIEVYEGLKLSAEEKF